MSDILVMAETRRGELRDVSLELIAAGQEIKQAAGGRLVVAVVDHVPDRFVAALSVEGVDELLLVSTPTEHFDARVSQRILEQLIEAEKPALVLLGQTVDALGYGPAVAANQALGFASDVASLAWNEGLVAGRGTYGDKLFEKLEFPDKACTVVLLRTGVFEPGAARTEVVPTRVVQVALDGLAATEHMRFEEVEDSGVDITKAPFLLAIGRGVGDREEVPRLEELAQRLGATLSASRPPVDAAWVPSSCQVGQSGKTVKPRAYLALGISGAIQHLAGMRNAETIIAVNKDAEAPIFAIAHYGVVADLFDVVDGLERELG